MKRLFPSLQLHSAFPVDSLRVRWVPLVPSFQRLGPSPSVLILACPAFLGFDSYAPSDSWEDIVMWLYSSRHTDTKSHAEP